ncbi:hypothetical protein L6452_02498 [Arctium lappa]|uniref:Uncharacterized protein n=1 Tax=Arctium lappa TaxID=4217 RepID=A0ACB9FK39_ARCLA|nr:hypothetical protein L6452_02498 [Arctium lappa]
MTADEGSAIVISDETGSFSVGSKLKNTHDGSSSLQKKREHSLLDTLAESRESPPSPHVDQIVEDIPTASPTSSPPQLSNEAQPQITQTSVGVKLQETLDVAMEATDEILRITKDVSTPSINMVEVEPPLKPFVSPTPSFDLNKITKPRTRLEPSLRQNVTIALADLDQLLGLNIPPQPKIPVETTQEGVNEETNVHNEEVVDSQPSETHRDKPPSQEKKKSLVNFSFDAYGMIEENGNFDDNIAYDEEPTEPQMKIPLPVHTTDFTNNMQDKENEVDEVVDGTRVMETKDVAVHKKYKRTNTRSTRKRKGDGQHQTKTNEENQGVNLGNQEGSNE